VANYITIDGLRMAYTLCGDGPPVLLLHGWTCNQRFWEPQIEALSTDHRVLAPDFRGHGESDVPINGCTLARLAEDVHEMMWALDMAPAAVVGHSMGGMVAQQLALSHPEDLSALVLVATAAADPDGQLISGRIASDAVEAGYRDAFLRYFPGWFPADGDPDLREWVRSQMLRTPERVALGLVEDYRDFDFRNDLPGIRVPALVVAASSDVSTAPARSQEIARLIPGAKLVTIERAGHFVHLERPREVNAALHEFLSEHGM
jgi:pimeloyl-ACP methyl ester carboxylesterase